MAPTSCDYVGTVMAVGGEQTAWRSRHFLKSASAGSEMPQPPRRILARQHDLDAVQPPGRGCSIRTAAISGLIHIVVTSGVTAKLLHTDVRMSNWSGNLRGALQSKRLREQQNGGHPSGALMPYKETM